MVVNHLTRADLAGRTGCNLETIRYYEKIGLLEEPHRGSNGYRMYEDGHVRGLRFILRSRELGFSIEDIRALLGLMSGGKRTCNDVRQVAEHHLTDVQAKIADLRHVESVLTQTIARCGAETTPHCPMIEYLNHGTT